MGESLSLSPLHSRQWLEDALRENEAGSCFIFLVGTKKDLLVSRVALEVWVALGKMPSLSALIGGAVAGEGGGTVGSRQRPIPRGLPAREPGMLGQRGLFLSVRSGM